MDKKITPSRKYKTILLPRKKEPKQLKPRCDFLPYQNQEILERKIPESKEVLLPTDVIQSQSWAALI
ncbi:MAG: hypothetical protein BTN85_1884 [Candidatus Methanohalarchaeum thermophilum]|uniref:Uncharacterized protein n=1 Tax=Methanohalarchaeum thermophilum TaxID=1903181 RepID=A0A1Q6DS88_METT1|nr:MAG: hypothetical protein BTN85_1884 [Candidatus Methanohalarchaeum thermophilum]